MSYFFKLGLLGCLVVLALTGCAKKALEASVTGTVSYNLRIALPPDATVIVKIEDVSRADAPSTVIGEQEIKTEGKQVPIPYEVLYDPAEIIDNHTYTVSARILDGSGKLIFISDTITPVITDGNPTEDVEVIVVQVK